MSLLLAFACILAAAGLGAVVARPIGVPIVVGQMCGGVLVGPLLAGSIWPGWYRRVFTMDNKVVIAHAGTVSACLFLFIAGASHPIYTSVRRRDVTIVAATNALAAAVGTVLILALIRALGTAAPDAMQCVFIGLVFSVCAVPVLIRIIDEKRLTGHRAANYALAIAVSTDVVVWCIVAVLGTGYRHGDEVHAVGHVTIALATLVAWRLLRAPLHRAIVSANSAPGVLLTACVCAAVGIGICELAGLDPLIGALLAGVAFGTSRTERTAPWFLRPGWFSTLNSTIALPIFFASAGLAVTPQHDVGTLVVLSSSMTVVAIGVRAAAVYGSRRHVVLDGPERRTTFWLICARGGTELALLRVGRDQSLLPAALYAPAVLMAIATTLLSGVLTRRARPAQLLAATETDGVGHGR